MPFFRTTYNILTEPQFDELFDPNWMDSDKLVLPPKQDWDYARELRVEDVHVWEVLYQASGGIGVYAAWDPYAEFYLLTTGWHALRPGQNVNDRIIETYYGPGANQAVQQRTRQLGIHLQLHQVWVEPEDMWLHEKGKVAKTGHI